MVVILHAKADQPVQLLSAELLKENDFIVLAGPVGAFDASGWDTAPGEVGGAVLRVSHLTPRHSAFEVLAECLCLCQRLLAEHLCELRYYQPQDEQDALHDDTPVAWSALPDGSVTAFRLAPMVASSPLLATVSRDLAGRTMTDDRRFTFLAAAFAGA
ncbi:hypothetical protein [Paracoccus sp. PAMC 22219]|uniref:hypothetical protein n=1 Tax=Paracoccus sp. PAMC 22219 TaxID=1569209 RepID=UPI0005A91344|nr:hypothetical protein [Paracoccus sp. PAMC 22219]